MTRDTGHGATWAQQWIADEIAKGNQMKLTATLCAIALLTTQATAEGIKPQREPVKPPVSQPVTAIDNGVDLLPVLLFFLGAALVINSHKGPQNPPAVTDQEYIFEIK